MCEYCENGHSILSKNIVLLNMVQWCGETKAKDLNLLEDEFIFFIDRGFLRFVNKDDMGCLDHGDKVVIKYCPFCGKVLNKNTSAPEYNGGSGFYGQY